jgi:hypothetical protein
MVAFTSCGAQAPSLLSSSLGNGIKVTPRASLGCPQQGITKIIMINGVRKWESCLLGSLVVDLAEYWLKSAMTL